MFYKIIMDIEKKIHTYAQHNIDMQKYHDQSM